MKFIVVLLLTFTSSAQALSLFGLELASAERGEMRAAVKKKGAKVISEAQKTGFFDVYQAQSLLPGAERLYLGFDLESQRWAFAEYEFNGLRHPAVVELLRGRYGEPGIEKTRFISDTTQHWTVDGVHIQIYTDWSAYKTRLVYRNPELTGRLKQLYAQSGGAQSGNFADLEASDIY